jgi:hypothetical protein
MNKELISISKIDIPNQLMEKLGYQKFKSIPLQFSSNSTIDLAKYNINPQTYPLIALNAYPSVHAQLWLRGFETLEFFENGAYRMKIHTELRNQGASISYISTPHLVPGKIEPPNLHDKTLYFVVSEESISEPSIISNLPIIRALGYGFVKIIPIFPLRTDVVRNLAQIGITKESISQVAISAPTFIAIQLWEEGFQTIEFLAGGAYIIEFNIAILSTWIPLEKKGN